MSTLLTHNVRVFGDPAAQPIVFAHGYGCEQGMWRFVAPEFTSTHRVVLFDHMGLGGSDVSLYDPQRYATLEGYADDVLEILRELDLRDVVFVGHSVSSMIGALAAKADPERFAALVMIGPSPRYVDDPQTGYRGGFSPGAIDDLLGALANDYRAWSGTMAPVIMGAPSGDPLSDELAETFCRADPEIAHRFARATFLGDNRDDLADVPTRTLVIQTENDAIAPEVVGHYVADTLPRGEFAKIDAFGHCPNLSAPAQTTAAIKAFLEG